MYWDTEMQAAEIVVAKRMQTETTRKMGVVQVLRPDGSVMGYVMKNSCDTISAPVHVARKFSDLATAKDFAASKQPEIYAGYTLNAVTWSEALEEARVRIDDILAGR